uniref:Uncharacterized protein n=1 Tax=Gasterosteus aculeatus aculeatus TaxID=481459 RepID=A0AAQ4QJE8_GASAC
RSPLPPPPRGTTLCWTKSLSKLLSPECITQRHPRSQAAVGPNEIPVRRTDRLAQHGRGQGSWVELEELITAVSRRESPAGSQESISSALQGELERILLEAQLECERSKDSPTREGTPQSTGSPRPTSDQDSDCITIQRVCVPAPEAAKLPEREEDGGDEEGNLLLRCFPHPCSLTAGVTLAHTWSRDLHWEAFGCFNNKHAVTSAAARFSPSITSC